MPAMRMAMMTPSAMAAATPGGMVLFAREALLEDDADVLVGRLGFVLVEPEFGSIIDGGAVAA